MRNHNILHAASVAALIALLGLVLHAGPAARAAAPRQVKAAAQRKPVGEELKAAREAAWKKAEKHLADAEQKFLDAARRAEKEVNDLFDKAKRGARPLAEELLSFNGKWNYLFSTEAEYRYYLKKEYEAHIFKSDALRKALEGATERFLRELDAIEGELMVAVRADLEDLPRGTLPAAPDAEAFREQFGRTEKQVQKLLAQNMKETVALLLAGEVAQRIVFRLGAAAATRLGISATILGTGAYSTVASLGVGLAAGFVADYLLDFLLRQFFGYDPEGGIAAQVCDGLEKMRRSLTEPDEEYLKVVLALKDRVHNDPDGEVRMACYVARLHVHRAGKNGLLNTLGNVGRQRHTGWIMALENLTLGASPFGDAFAKAQQDEGPGPKAESAEEAKDKAGGILLLAGERSADVNGILRVLGSKNPDHRILAAKAAALLHGRAEEGAAVKKSPSGIYVK